MGIKPYNPKARWKKLFSREYSVQYTEISLRSLSPEVKDLLPYTFYEQVYIPEENNEVCYVDEAKWNNFLNRIQKDWATDNVKKFRLLFLKTGNEYVSYAKSVAKLNLKNKSNDEIVKAYRDYQRICTRYTLFIWAAYFLNDFCAERARRLIQKKLKNEDPHPYFDIVFTPLKRAAILNLTNIVSTKEKLSDKEIKELFERYKWIPCLDIHNQAWNFKEFKNHLKDFKKKKQVQQMTYKQAVKKLALNKKEEKILGYAKFFAYVKDLRDDFRRQGIFYIQNSLFKELAERIGISISDMAYLQENEIIRCLEKGLGCDKNLIEERKKGFVIMYNHLKEKVCVSGSKANDALINLGFVKAKHLPNFHGMPASRGIAKGLVAIIKGVKDLSKVKNGDVLIAVTTHPDYVPAMQKASAIVTDEGGITSHASIVSRELGIPCVVGTKTATNILNDGDYVEVDGSNGKVRVLKKKA